MPKKSLIYGYGITGKSFERYLLNQSIDFDIYHENKKIPNFKDYETIYCSPGISKDIFEELDKNFNVLTDIDIFFRKDKSIKIGITGTNRKSTTCYHLYQLFQQNSSVNLIGNIGNPVLDSLNNGSKFSIIELSSFQLHKAKEINLDFGVLLNLSKDHLDYHGTFKDYKKAKKRICEADKFSSCGNPYKLYEWITGKKSSKVELKNLPHRFEILSSNYINDSKSTNSHSLQYALNKANEFFKNNYALIMCGNPKKEKIKSLNIHGPSMICIFGKHKKELNKIISHPKKVLSNDIKDCFHEINQNEIQNILFSPGMPSPDDFINFEERGNYFIDELNFYQKNGKE